ncbi:DUF4402 domain-containing protein [Altererythrobacter sp.]|nr:DUF4402 domain-containing protein [Altererythrobacter sp.]
MDWTPVPFALRKPRAARRGGLRLLLAVLCIASLPAAAQAQSQAGANRHTSPSAITVLQRLRLTKIANMDFGKIVLATNAGGSIELTPEDTAACTLTGDLIRTSTCRAAEFGGAGDQGSQVRFRLPNGNSVALTGPGQDMRLTDFTIGIDHGLAEVTTPGNSGNSNGNGGGGGGNGGGGNGGGNGNSGSNGWSRYTISDSTGVFGLFIGGTLTVNPNQAGGVYTASFDMRVDYE